MSPQLQNVNEVVKQVRKRIRIRNTLRGVVITLAVAALSLVIVALVAGLLKQHRAALAALRILPVMLSAIAAWLFVARPLRAKLDDSRIARLIEEKSGLGDRLVTAVEYSENPRDASPAIVGRLVDDASRRSSSIELDRVIDPRHAYAYGAAAALILFGLIGALVLSPKAVSSGLAALYSGDDDSVAASSMFINVSPGTTRVPRGSDLKIKATLAGFDSMIAQVFMRRVGADNWVASTMEPGKNSGEFQFVIFNIQDSANYYIEAKDIRSNEFALEVADLPFVKQIDLVLDFPAYTHLASKKIENGGEVAALKGTVVQVIAHLSADAKAARILVSDGTKAEMVGGNDNTFVGQFAVKQNGTYRIELTSEGGERYNGSNEYDITVLEDHAPTVVVDKPGRDMKVTNIQEVFTQVRAEDDYGVTSVELYFSVNGGEEKKVQLQDLKNDAAHTLSGAHTFFLEEYKLQPGDFISYYAKARDNSANPQESTSDIYFMEVRPFDREFRQSQQQGQGQGGDQDSNALTRRQREIIAATFRVQREFSSYTPQEKDENVGAVTLSQEKLKADAENLAERIRRRLGDQLNSEPEFAKLVEYVGQAAKEMGAAIEELRAKKTKEAMPPEQRSLQQLLRAEAIFRDIQVARGGGQGQGNQQQQQQELADLFELQLDKMKNQYETVQNQQQQAQSQQQDDIARRLAELARRQQQQLEGRMRSQMQQQGGGGGGAQRQQQEMIDEAQKMARELERLARDRRDPKLAEAAQQMQQAADELRRAQASQSQSSSSSQAGGQQAAADQLRALQRMEQARQMLESAQRAGGQQNVQQLRQRAEEALKRQEEIGRSVDELARSGQAGAATAEKKQQIAERKQALADQVSGLERDLDQAARGMGQERQQSSDKLREAAGAIRQNRIPDRIRQNQQMIANDWFDQARERERIIKGNLDEVLKDIQAAEGGAGKRAQGESLEDALNRARELADNLESLQRKIESGNQQGQDPNGRQQGQQGQQANQSGQQGQRGQQQGQQGSRDQRGQQSGQQNQQGQQAGSQSGQPGQQTVTQGPNQQAGRQRGQNQQSQSQQAGRQGQQGQRGQQQGQQGQQQGQQGQPGQQQGQQGQQQGQQGQQGQQQGQQGQQGSQQGQGQQPNQQGGRPTNGSVEDPSSMGGGPPRGGQRQLESELRQRLADAEELKRALGRNSDLARDLNRAIDQLRRINPNAFADPAQLALLKSEVIDPLRQLEIELARRLQARLGNNGAGALGDGEAPDRYRKMIEDYYRRLSARSPDRKP
ncbi:MAG TPA: DUF4175 family protein [Blastocatellia bacterium]|nr:DUF4175 family protein [Blastocatellia bacterium]